MLPPGEAGKPPVHVPTFYFRIDDSPGRHAFDENKTNQVSAFDPKMMEIDFFLFCQLPLLPSSSSSALLWIKKELGLPLIPIFFKVSHTVASARHSCPGITFHQNSKTKRGRRHSTQIMRILFSLDICLQHEDCQMWMSNVDF